MEETDGTQRKQNRTEHIKEALDNIHNTQHTTGTHNRQNTQHTTHEIDTQEADAKGRNVGGGYMEETSRTRTRSRRTERDAKHKQEAEQNTQHHTTHIKNSSRGLYGRNEQNTNETYKEFYQGVIWKKQNAGDRNRTQEIETERTTWTRFKMWLLEVVEWINRSGLYGWSGRSLRVV